MIKGSIQDDITIVNICAPNIGAPKYINQILMDIKAEINSNTVIAGDFNIPLTSVNRASRQKINKKIMALNATPAQIDLIDIFRIFYPKTKLHIFLKCTWNIFQDNPHIKPQIKP